MPAAAPPAPRPPRPPAQRPRGARGSRPRAREIVDRAAQPQRADEAEPAGNERDLGGDRQPSKAQRVAAAAAHRLNGPSVAIRATTTAPHTASAANARTPPTGPGSSRAHPRTDERGRAARPAARRDRREIEIRFTREVVANSATIRERMAIGTAARRRIRLRARADRRRGPYASPLPPSRSLGPGVEPAATEERLDGARKFAPALAPDPELALAPRGEPVDPPLTAAAGDQSLARRPWRSSRCNAG